MVPLKGNHQRPHCNCLVDRSDRKRVSMLPSRCIETGELTLAGRLMNQSTVLMKANFPWKWNYCSDRPWAILKCRSSKGYNMQIRDNVTFCFEGNKQSVLHHSRANLVGAFLYHTWWQLQNEEFLKKSRLKQSTSPCNRITTTSSCFPGSYLSSCQNPSSGEF